MTRTACLLALAAAVLATAACGGGSGRLSKSQYEARMSAIYRTVAAPTRPPTLSIGGDVPAYFAKLATRLENAAAQAKAIKPPRDVQAIQTQIVAGAKEEADAVQSLARRLKGATKAQVIAVLREFDPTTLSGPVHELEAANAALAAKGYKISSTSGG